MDALAPERVASGPSRLGKSDRSTSKWHKISKKLMRLKRIGGKFGPQKPYQVNLPRGKRAISNQKPRNRGDREIYQASVSRRPPDVVQAKQVLRR